MMHEKPAGSGEEREREREAPSSDGKAIAPPAFTFRPIHVHHDYATLLKFRRDSFLVSMGSAEGMGNENAYLAWMALNSALYPDGFLMMEHDGKVIGQTEAEIILYQGRRIGYVDLFYLVPEYRGKGYGKVQLDRAEAFFRHHGVNEYHLRVSATNERAIRFYKKHGFYKLKEEVIAGHLMWRLGKVLD